MLSEHEGTGPSYEISSRQQNGPRPFSFLFLNLFWYKAMVMVLFKELQELSLSVLIFQPTIIESFITIIQVKIQSTYRRT
jgi:hypothetical protein